MRILGIDFGEKNIGVAVSDELGLTAQALKTIRRRGIRKDLEALGAVIEEYSVEQMVIGLPRNMDGSLGPSAEKALAFVDRLKVFNLPVATEDERLTTVIAEKALIEGDVRRARRRQVINQMAAALILQGHLDRLSRERRHEN
jgi:putative Holliday junction resolvase